MIVFNNFVNNVQYDLNTKLKYFYLLLFLYFKFFCEVMSTFHNIS